MSGRPAVTGLKACVAVLGVLLVTHAVLAQGTTRRPRVVIDGGHHNFHTLAGGFAAFAELLQANRFDVRASRGRITRASLEGVDVFVSANPFPDPRETLIRLSEAAGEPFRWSAAAGRSAFSDDEVAMLQRWVRGGGTLLLALDHAPHGATGGALAAAFGVETRNVETTDSLHRDPTSNAGSLLFTREAGLVGTHPILEGVDSVVTYLGQSLGVNDSGVVLLRLPSTAMDRDWLIATKSYRLRSARERAQAVALEYGRGRVVVLGEAGMHTSDLESGLGTSQGDGIARGDRGNRRFALGIMQWLTRQPRR